MKDRLVQKAIIEDQQLQRLNAERVKICSLATPTVVLKDGKEVVVWIDETTEPLLSKINELIEHRINQIKRFYDKYPH